MNILVKHISPEEADRLGVQSWGTWSCDSSEFDWEYDEKETCYIIEGEVTVETEEGSVSLGPGDYVEFPAGLKCRWKVLSPVKKYYRFG